MDKLFEKEELLLKDIKKFQKILKKEVDKNDYVDVEEYHTIEDDILHKYIKLVASNKLKKLEIVKIAKEISIVNEYMDKLGRWYA
jgi:ATP-dependent Lon protease